jgi:hypothetical protein
MELSTKQTVLGMKMMKMIKKHVKNKSTPTKEEIMQLAKVCNADSNTIESASTTLMNEGVNTLMNSGAIPSTEITQIIEKITSQAGDFSNFGEFAEKIVSELPIDPSAKMLAAAFLGGD